MSNEDNRYGMVLAKEKNDEKAMQYLIRSVHKYTMNWGCWLEMTSLISRAEDVRASLCLLRKHIPTNSFI